MSDGNTLRLEGLFDDLYRWALCAGGEETDQFLNSLARIFEAPNAQLFCFQPDGRTRTARSGGAGGPDEIASELRSALAQKISTAADGVANGVLRVMSVGAAVRLPTHYLAVWAKRGRDTFSAVAMRPSRFQANSVAEANKFRPHFRRALELSLSAKAANEREFLQDADVGNILTSAEGFVATASQLVLDEPFVGALLTISANKLRFENTNVQEAFIQISRGVSPLDCISLAQEVATRGTFAIRMTRLTSKKNFFSEDNHIRVLTEIFRLE